MCSEGAVIRSDPRTFDGGHAWIVLHDPAAHEKTLLVNWTSLTTATSDDRTVVLQHGQHPLVRHGSWVWFARARLVPSTILAMACKQNLIVPHPTPLSRHLLILVRSGFERSKRTRPEHLQHLRDLGLLENDSGAASRSAES